MRPSHKRKGWTLSKTPRTTIFEVKPSDTDPVDLQSPKVGFEKLGAKAAKSSAVMVSNTDRFKVPVSDAPPPTAYNVERPATASGTKAISFGAGPSRKTLFDIAPSDGPAPLGPSSTLNVTGGPGKGLRSRSGGFATFASVTPRFAEPKIDTPNPLQYNPSDPTRPTFDSASKR
jgi:hypothetical protein